MDQLNYRITNRLAALALTAVLGIYGIRLLAAEAENGQVSKVSETKYQSPEDVIIKLVPILGKIPRKFSWGKAYAMKFGDDRLQMDHKGRNLGAPVKKHACLISLAYRTRVSGFLSSGMDLPLFNIDQFRYSSMAFNRRGDYDVFISRQSVAHTSLQLMAKARF